MSGLPFMAGAALGAALVASLYSDSFRDACKKGINTIGDEINKQIATAYKDITGFKKEVQNDGQSGNDGQVLHDKRRSNGLPARVE